MEDSEIISKDAEPFPAQPSARAEEPSKAKLRVCDAAQQEAAKAREAGNLDNALDHYTRAILTGAASAMVHAKRAMLLLELQRPQAAIKDCNVALEINPDLGKAHRIRG